MRKDSTIGTFLMATCVCVVCSVVVCTAAVLLKPIQDKQREADKRKNVLLAAGITEYEGTPVEKLSAEEIIAAFDAEIESQWLDLKTGKSVPIEEVPEDCRDEVKAAKSTNDAQSTAITEDIAKLGRRANYREIYLKRDAEQNIETIILPVHGKGLWSTMYGFLALESDGIGIKSLSFYQHGETPGLGGEIDNKKWKGYWKGKKAFDESKQPADELWVADIAVIKGNVLDDDPRRDYKVDGISGATLTANGVRDLVRFWLGEEGYGPFLQAQRTGGDDG